MPFGLDRTSVLRSLQHGSYRAFVVPPEPHPLFKTYEVNWWAHDEVFSIAAESDFLEDPLRAQIEFSVALDLLDRRYGPVYRAFDTDFSGGLWADLRLGLVSRMVMWDENEDDRRGFAGLETVIADLRAESGERFKIRVDYDLKNSLSSDLTAGL